MLSSSNVRILVFKHFFRKFSSESIIKSKAKVIQIPKVTLHEHIWENLDKWSDKTATVCFETQRSYTYHQLYKRSLSVTSFLNESLKYRNKETVGVVLPNVPEYPIILLGASQAGVRVTPCNPSYTSDEIRKQLKDSEARLVFTSTELLPVVRAATDLPIVEISKDKSVSNGVISFDEISSKDTNPSIKNSSPDDIILLPYSSGTTGLPKGVQLTHLNVVANLCQITSPDFNLIRRTEGNKQDTIPALLPFFHIYGLVVVLLKSLVQGAKVLTMPKFSSDNFVKLLRNHKTDVLYGVPLMVILANNNPNIKKEDLIGMRCFMSGAAPLGGSDVERFRSKTEDKVSIIQGYGMTETSPVTIIQTDQLEYGIKTGGTGLLIPNTEAKIISLDGHSSTNLDPHQSGELVIRGPQVMHGYYNNPEANADIFLGDGWLRTGDISYYDEHEHFYIIDRCKELIKVKGFQVAPAEIEEVLRCHPGVDDVGVVGVAHDVLGEAPRAFVVIKAGQSVKSTELEEFVASKVAKHKHLNGGVVLVTAIPKSASGKILRKELRKL